MFHFHDSEKSFQKWILKESFAPKHHLPDKSIETWNLVESLGKTDQDIFAIAWKRISKSLDQNEINKVSMDLLRSDAQNSNTIELKPATFDVGSHPETNQIGILFFGARFDFPYYITSRTQEDVPEGKYIIELYRKDENGVYWLVEQLAYPDFNLPLALKDKD